MFNPWQDGLKQEIPLERAAGLEVLVASLGERAAEFRYTSDQRGPWLTGQGGFTTGDLELGLLPGDQVDQILRALWMTVMPAKVVPEPFGQRAIDDLRAMIEDRERNREGYYYITVLPEQRTSPMVDPAVLSRLLAVLPSLRVLHLVGPQGQDILFVPEATLWASLVNFFRML